MKKFILTIAVMTMAVGLTSCADKESTGSDTTAEAFVTTEDAENTEITTEETTTRKATTEQSSTSVPQTTEASAPQVTEAPVHQHTWPTKTVVVKEAWTEIIEHPAMTHKEYGYMCNYCGNMVYSEIDVRAHQDQFLNTDMQHAVAEWSSFSNIVSDQEAWTEKVGHPAETKAVEYCTECGIEK
ncbi:MAG: hypothetical protein NC240_03155 [Clostridium sp.]|nr:hypothetical protein [Clostridium sp.]